MVLIFSLLRDSGINRPGHGSVHSLDPPWGVTEGPVNGRSLSALSCALSFSGSSGNSSTLGELVNISLMSDIGGTSSFVYLLKIGKSLRVVGLSVYCVGGTYLLLSGSHHIHEVSSHSLFLGFFITDV